MALPLTQEDKFRLNFQYVHTKTRHRIQGRNIELIELEGRKNGV
jgi:hypothetical protein